MKPIIKAASIKHSQDSAECQKGIWVPARPLFLASLRERFIAAFGVLVGKYDAVNWQDNIIKKKRKLKRKDY